MHALKAFLSGSGICCLSGASGAGKTTLLNALLGIRRETGSLSPKINRGRNTTRVTELLESDGLRIIDTAGFSLLEAEHGMDPRVLRERYPEFRELGESCRFRECLHDREPGCAVSEAARMGVIDAERLGRYRQLLHELQENWRNRYD